MRLADDALSPAEFERITAFVHSRVGIQLGDEKRAMVEARLRKRLKALDLPSLSAYCEYLFGDAHEDEQAALFDVITTNKTDFFRENRHFEYLAGEGLAALEATAGDRAMQFWSAACSTGEEPYTLAMVLAEHAATRPGYRFRVLATDLSTEVLAHAERAVYSKEAVAPVPAALRAKYLMRSKSGDGRHRVVPELRERVEFRRLNLMDRDFQIPERMDAIFCRNVLIYFSRTTQRDLLMRLAHQLRPNGMLFVGHTETLSGMGIPLTQVAPSIYIKDGRTSRLHVLKR